MSTGEQPSVMILTASFGEGHNSAAKGLAAALEGRADRIIADPCALGQPRTNVLCKWGYQFLITHLPRVWAFFFKISDRHDMSKDSLWALRGVQKATDFELDNMNPDVVLSTYPLYPYFIDRYAARTGRKILYYVVVTDSLVINKSWLCVSPEAWLVTDDETKRRMMERGIPEDRITVTGFPVSPRIADYPPLPADAWRPGDTVRILYFANGTAKNAKTDLAALAESLPEVRITVVLGRNVRRLYRAVESVEKQYPEKFKIIGWTRRVPQLMSEHHLIVGKAGGATVHEALNAQCPILINQVVFGQEQGNVQLLEHMGAGQLAVGREALQTAVRDIFDTENPHWPEMKKRLSEAGNTGGAAVIADLVLQAARKRVN